LSEYSERFIAYLIQLRAQDRGAVAKLRRSLGSPPGEYVPAFSYVERFVPDRHATDHYRQALYLVAGLFALHPKPGSKSLAASLGQLMRDRESDSTEKRFLSLLGADPENLSNYLRQVVSLLAADDLGIDYAALLDDLARWLNSYAVDTRDQIRQRWARDFYRELAPRKSESEQTSSATTSSH
jgi:CRISPR system Cascade subunit CasB